MLVLADDAREIAAAIEDLINTGAPAGQEVKATVKADEISPKSIPAGAGRPRFIRYFIHIAHGSRGATLELGEAADLLDELEAGWDPERLFAALQAREVPIDEEPAEDAT